MENTFMNYLTNFSNYKHTENGALAYKSTNSKVYDMFAFGGAYRNRMPEDCILLFKEAYEENKELALKCLFYLRDCRGGQGERRFFRTCFRFLCNKEPAVARNLLIHVSEYGRWDDLIFVSIDTPVEEDAFKIIRHQLALDVECKTPSLLAKWLPSENASSKETKTMGNKIRKYLKMTHKQYRKTLSILRNRIKVLERLMSTNRWDEIEFDKIPSKAGLIYKNAFARRDIIAQRYESFIKDAKTKVNAKTLYPYEIVKDAIECSCYFEKNLEREAINKYWANQIDYFKGKECSLMCVIDTSASMRGTPMDAAIALGIYCAERNKGLFKDHYISFSSRPKFVKIEGIDFVDKVRRIYNANLIENTNIEAAFDLLLQAAKSSKVEDIPKTLVIISDMEIDAMSNWRNGKEQAQTEMERIRAKWKKEGLQCPKLIYWNVDARNNTILDSGPNVSYVSGLSPVLFEQILTGVTGIELMLQKLLSERYANITL